MRCFDTAKIYAKAGDGGNGVVAFRREKYVPNGGPSGGNGGKGGAVYIVADRALNSLLPFRRSVHFRALRGAHGQGSKCHGEAGKDVEISVPPGTVIRESLPGGVEGPVLVELVRAGQRELLLPGGKGGRGNAAFKTGKNRAPQLAEFGEKGPEMWLQLELKLVADVGIIGVPNAGKSTLLSAISAAKPKVANYPFTTLVPNLGVVGVGYDSMVVADVPGLLEGAHTGVGLGQEFLRHTERCRVLIHVIDGTRPQPLHDFQAICNELLLFNPLLADKPQIVAYNKTDVTEASQKFPDFVAAMRGEGVEVLGMSAVSGEGTLEVVRAAHRLLQQVGRGEEGEEGEEAQEAAARRGSPLGSVGEAVRARRNEGLELFYIESDKHTRTFRVHGEGVERFCQMTNWEYYEAVKRFQHVLESSGVNTALSREGVREGDSVVIGQMTFNWHDSSDSGNLGEWKRGNRGSHVWPH